MGISRLAINGGPRTVPVGAIRPWPEIRAADKRAVLAVLERGDLMSFPGSAEGSALEREWASWIGQDFCLATNSGTAALHMAVAAVGVKPGDEVITTPLSWTSTATCALHHNAIPIFADIEALGYNIDPAKIEAKITSRTKAIIPVHLYGLPADMDPIMEIAGRHGLAVIEDACQAHGAEYKGRKVGTIGQVAAFSLNAGKLLSGGEGGLLVTNDERIWQEAARVQQFGENRRSDGVREYDSYGMGWMYRTTELAAAFARSQLRRLDEILEQTRANAHYLSEQLKGVRMLTTPWEPDDRKHVFYRYPVSFTPERAGVDLPIGEFTRRCRAALEAEGVALGRGEFLIPGMTLFRERQGYGNGCPWTCHGSEVTYQSSDYPVASAAIDRMVCLSGITPPNGRQLMEQYVEAVYKVDRNCAQLME
jgi:dTDP-4-amino-4,6-dideoxygalactose transaminase